MHSIGNNGTGRTADRTLPTAIPDLIYPAIQWNEDDYATLQVRLDLFNDFVLLSKFSGGKVTQQYPVDPTEVATRVNVVQLIIDDGRRATSGTVRPSCRCRAVGRRYGSG